MKKVESFISGGPLRSKIPLADCESEIRWQVRAMNDTHSESPDLHALCCSFSSRRQLAVVMGNEEPESRDAAVSRTPHFSASNVRSYFRGCYAPILLRAGKTSISACRTQERKRFSERYGVDVKQSSGQAGAGAKPWFLICSRKRGGPQAHLIDAPNQVDTMQREWRCWRSGLPAISEIHAVTFFPPHATLHLPCRGTVQA